MNQQKKLEAVLEYVLNGEEKEASALLHEIIVETATNLYNGMMETEEDALGGEETGDFLDSLAPDEDAEVGGEEVEEVGAEEELSVEDRVEELEDSLESLRAEFDKLLGGEEEMDLESDVEEFDAAAEPELVTDGYMGEATNFQDKVKVNMNSEDGGVNKKNTFATGQKFTDKMGGGAHKTGAGGDEKVAKVAVKSEDAADNLNTAEKKVSTPDAAEKADNVRSPIAESRKAARK